MKKSLLIITLFCFSFLGAQNSKKVITESRTTADYDKISTSGSFDVVLIAGKEGNITIKAEPKLMELIKTEVKDGELSVYFETPKLVTFNYTSTIEITIPIENISELSFSGSGNLTAANPINSENLQFTMSGSGNVKFETVTTNLKVTKSGSGNAVIQGKAENLKVDASGSGNANLSDLKTENTTASQSGSGNIKIFCTKNLLASLKGSGSIQYRGNPQQVDKDSSGSGSITGS